MISVVHAKTPSGAALALRLSTAAIVRVERHFGLPISEVLSEAKSAMSVEKVAIILGAASNEGKGCSEDDAFALVDDFGGAQAAAVCLGQVIEAAFPQPSDEGESVEAAGETSGKPKKPVK